MAVKTYKKGDTAKLSKNFSVYEFRCGLGRGCSCTTTLIDEKLPQHLQAIRDTLEKKHPDKEIVVIITSAHRCARYNRSVNGATSSRHTKGQAADIVVPGIPPLEVAQTAESLGILGIGLYEAKDCGDDFVHVDERETKSFWYGHKQACRSTFGGAAAGGSTASTPAESYTLRQFITDVQKATGAAVDGVAGPKTLARTVTISQSRNKRHALVEPIQKRLQALGYTVVGKADGVAGKKFDEALKAFQFDHNCVVDGEATKGAETWQHLLGMK